MDKFTPPLSEHANTRNSSVELLRIVAIVMIISLHLMGKWWNTGNMVNREIIVFLNAIFNTGSSMFILISGYYGIRCRFQKVFHLWFMTWTYTVPLFFISWWLLGDYGGAKMMAHSFFPILTNYKWFITSYILLSLFSPYINRGIERIGKGDFERLLWLGCFFFVIAPTFLFFGIMKDTGKGIANMMLVYLIGRYLRMYGIPRCFSTHKVGKSLALILIIFLGNSLFTWLRHGIVGYFAWDSSLFIVCLSVILFCCFIERNFQSNLVNRLARYCFPVYLFSDIVWVALGKYINQYIDSYWCWAVMPLLLSVAIIASIVYETLRNACFSKLEKILCERAVNRIGLWRKD